MAWINLTHDQFFNLIYRCQEVGIFLDFFFNFVAGADNCRMITVAEFFSNLHIRQIQKLAAEIDGDMSGIGYVLRAGLAGDLGTCQAVVVRNTLDDLL